MFLTLSIEISSTSTVGAVGQRYVNTSNGDEYTCEEVSGDTYTWRLHTRSVNGKRPETPGGNIQLDASDIGAAPEFQYSVGSPALTGRKWIDGSDIYAIVIQGTTGAVTTGTYYQFPVSIDMVVSIQGFIQLSGARFWPFPGGVDGPAASHTAIQALVVANGASANANSLYLNIGNSVFASMPFVAILEYTEASV